MVRALTHARPQACAHHSDLMNNDAHLPYTALSRSSRGARGGGLVNIHQRGGGRARLLYPPSMRARRTHVPQRARDAHAARCAFVINMFCTAFYQRRISGVNGKARRRAHHRMININTDVNERAAHLAAATPQASMLMLHFGRWRAWRYAAYSARCRTTHIIFVALLHTSTFYPAFLLPDKKHSGNIFLLFIVLFSSLSLLLCSLADLFSLTCSLLLSHNIPPLPN